MGLDVSFLQHFGLRSAIALIAFAPASEPLPRGDIMRVTQHIPLVYDHQHPQGRQPCTQPEDQTMPTDNTTPDKTPSRPLRGASRHLRVVTASGDETPQTKRQTKVRTARSLDTGLTDKMEAFAQAVTSGSNLSDAYRASYVADQMDPASVHSLACRLMTDVKVRSRIDQLNREIEDNRRMMAVSDAEAALKTLRQMMRGADTDSVKVRAAELLAKASGMFTDKVEVTNTDRSVADIQQAISDRLRRLGLAG